MTGEQLKKSILQYAIQGKLVPQNPGDEPAKDLLKKIQDEKQKLIAEKKIKKDRNESFIYREGESFYEVRGKVVACIDDEIPFEIPESWEWARLGHLSTTIQYGYNAPAKEKGDIRFVRISDIQSGRVIWPSVPFCDIKEEDVLKYSLDTGDVLFARTGGTVGKSFFIKQMEYPAVFAGYLIRVKIHDKMFPEYIYKFMSSAFYWQQLRQGTVATAQPNCNAKTLAHMLIPVPPFEEQKRIVAKIEELLPYVEEYSAAEAAIGRLNKKLPEQLKKSILQYAIQGKLVSQCSKDRPAKALIKEIQEEKKQLIAEKKLKKDKNESFIYREGESFYEVCGKEVDCIDEEIPFDIPESWEWARLGFLSTYGSPTKKVKLRDVSSDTWCLELADIRKGGTLEKIQLAKESDSKGEKVVFSKGNILYSKLRPYLKKILLVDMDGVCSPEIVPFGVYGKLNGKYVVNYLKSPYIDQLVNEASYGVKMPRVGTETMKRLLVPVPPLEEQKRIVAKIEEAFAEIENLGTE